EGGQRGGQHGGDRRASGGRGDPGHVPLALLGEQGRQLLGGAPVDRVGEARGQVADLGLVGGGAGRHGGNSSAGRGSGTGNTAAVGGPARQDVVQGVVRGAAVGAPAAAGELQQGAVGLVRVEEDLVPVGVGGGQAVGPVAGVFQGRGHPGDLYVLRDR